MLQLGYHITSTNDPLKKIDNKQFFQMISDPAHDLISKINQLRTVLTIDKKKYQQAKRMLPYVTCGIFSPPYRRLENFASIDCFMVDIDHLQEKEINMDALCAKLRDDQSVEMYFISPGNNGLKVLFSLKEKCYDRAKYSMFYKLFIRDLSNRYGLDQVIDKVTSDATRACFLSADTGAYYNPEAIKTDISTYIEFDNSLEVERARRMIREFDDESKKIELFEKEEKKDLSPDILLEIKKKLNPDYRERKQKNHYVPPEIDQALDSVRKKMNEFSIEMVFSDPIHYGRKLRFKLGHRFAQINLFYGKKGFRLVKTPVSGSDSELNDVVFQILAEIFY